MKRIISVLLCIVLLVAQAFVMSSCADQKKKFSEVYFDYFDTVTTIIGYADTKGEFDEISSWVKDELEEYHKLFTIYDSFEGVNNLFMINELIGKTHCQVVVDDKIIDMLSYAKEMYELTSGKMNIAMGSVLSIWHNYRSSGISEPSNAQIPDMNELEEASTHTDINDIIIDKENKTVFISDPEATLDVGAIAKGYAVEQIARDMEKNGISGYIINVGGNVRTIGKKADGHKWTVGIENPQGSENDAYFAYLELENESVVTSGSYQRYYIVDGKRYHHIIDPETLMPAQRYLSVSVVSNNSAKADALSTALFCMDIEEGRELIESIDGTEAMWIMNDETRIYSSGFGNYELKR